VNFYIAAPGRVVNAGSSRTSDELSLVGNRVFVFEPAPSAIIIEGDERRRLLPQTTQGRNRSEDKQVK
jgi:hypothetical protein